MALMLTRICAFSRFIVSALRQLGKYQLEPLYTFPELVRYDDQKWSTLVFIDIYRYNLAHFSNYVVG